MKPTIRLAAIAGLLTFAGLCSAQEYGRVLSSTANVQQVAVPRQVCSSEQVDVQDKKSGAGAIMGAVAGGAIGNQIGKGAGNALATVIGIVGGAMAGDRIEGAGKSHRETVQNCSTQSVYENRISGYTVVYEYAGKRYSTQMANDPGPSIPLQVVPLGGTSTSPPAASGYMPMGYAPTYGPTNEWTRDYESSRERHSRSWY